MGLIRFGCFERAVEPFFTNQKVLWVTLILIFVVFFGIDVRICILNLKAREQNSTVQGLANRFGSNFTNAFAGNSMADWDQWCGKVCKTHAKRLADAGPITIISMAGDNFPIQWPVNREFRVHLIIR